MKKLESLPLLLALLLGGCRDATPHETVIVPDISQSIDADAEQQMFAAIEDVALHLHRGDTLTIIPITGNADADLQGRTLHYVVPSADERRAYDADLRVLNKRIKDDLAGLKADAVAHPGKHTDIIGSVRVAMKEFSRKPTDKRLIVLSDFIQDDNQFDFGKDPRLSTEAAAIELGKGLVLSTGGRTDVAVVLGRLRSNEFSALAPDRQHAINAFWSQVLPPAGIDPDGTAAVLRDSVTR